MKEHKQDTVIKNITQSEASSWQICVFFISSVGYKKELSTCLNFFHSSLQRMLYFEMHLEDTLLIINSSFIMQAGILYVCRRKSECS